MRLKIFLLPILIFIAGLPVFSQNKTALLIANGNYKNFSSLANPVTEASQLKAALQNLGFQVTLITNAGREQMLDGLMDFERSVKQRGGIAFFHYGGHAVQVAGSNYLIPANADIPDERRVSTRAVDAEEIMATLEASGSDTNIVILDSCRNNPLPSGSGRSASRGLAVAGKKPPNSIIVYSAESGTVARDGVFTPALIQALSMTEKSFQEILMQTRQRVYNLTNGAQIPGAYDQLFAPVYLAGIPSGENTGRIIPDGNSSPPAATASRPQVSEDFVLVKAGSFTMGSPSSEVNRGADETQHRVTLTRDFYMGKYEVTQGVWQEVMGSNPSDTSRGIGSGNPVNKVSWYDAVEFCNKLSLREGFTPAYSGSGDNILCNFNASGYRLPLEAEWEYAARGGVRAGGYNIYGGSDSIGSVAWSGVNSGRITHPVGQKQANELGLYDMSGNVWEWCWDRYGSYSGNATDPGGSASDSLRVLRGGSWSDNRVDYCRSANRASILPGAHYSNNGFRLVRTAQ